MKQPEAPGQDTPVGTEALARAFLREPTREELQETIRLLRQDVAHLSDQIRRGHHQWLDEVAAERQGEMLAFLLHQDPTMLWGDVCHRASSMAYDAAQALLAEGRQRREAKSE